MILMSIPTKITGYDRFMEKLNRKKRQANNFQPTSNLSNKPATRATKKDSAK